LNHPCAGSIISSSFLVSGLHRSTGTRTLARPAPPPFGADRRGRQNPRSEPVDVCASLSATHSTHPRSFWPPGTPSRAHTREEPPRIAATVCPGVLTTTHRLQATRAVRSHTGQSWS
jgi:hypothetical protein